MTEAEARTRIAVYGQVDTDPILTSDEVDVILADARRADADGNAPDDAAWTGTWDVNAAILSAWRLKAAKASARSDISTDGQSVARSQVVAHCERMALQYQRRIVTSSAYVGAYRGSAADVEMD